jgi:hypothetical protein
MVIFDAADSGYEKQNVAGAFIIKAHKCYGSLDGTYPIQRIHKHGAHIQKMKKRMSYDCISG